jgi:CBS domain-containing protein/mannitol/fructose-specific phosphotransferase system IIA component (Ntr-type)
MRRSGADEDRIRERLALLSTEDIVVLPDRAFIVHFRSDAVRSLLLMAGASASPICREAGDSEAQQCSQMLLLLIAPSRRAAEYLQMLGALGRFLSKQSVVEEILAHSDPASLESLLASLEFEVPEQLRVRDIMTARPRTTSGDTALRDAAKEMVRGSLGALIVVDQESRVVGMLGEKELMRDLLNNYLQGGTAHRDAPASTGRRRVKEVMTRQVLGVSPNQPLSEVASIMVNKDVERVPVVEDGKLVGALTRADVVRKIIGH